MESYHDYVIKDGKFVGEFEEMYQKFEDPWHQSESEHNRLSKARNASLINITRYGIKSLVEFGCGLGFYSDLIARTTGAKVIGVDISSTAIEKAKMRFPQIDFRVDEVKNLARYKSVDAILFPEITWYLLPQLKELFSQMQQSFSGKYFLHNLVFYPAENQKYGRDYFTNFEEFAEFCPFELLEWDISRANDPARTIDTSAIFKIQ